jgi:hypothetical protein
MTPEFPPTTRWKPQSEEELRAAIAQGLLEETHHLDLKREVESGRGANKELARDLAQFALDGGALLIGVEEPRDASPALAPLPLSGLPERVEQVATSLCDPPLWVSCSAIRSQADATRGYLWVDVPPSGLAPHMVDGAYYARGDKTRRRLSDAEVLQLHTARQQAPSRVERMLDDYIARDPVPAELRAQAHLYFVAAPLLPRHEMLVDVVAGQERHRLLRQFLDAATVNTRISLSPSLSYLGDIQRRPDGIAMVYGLTDGRRLQHDAAGDGFNEDALEVEFTDDGAVRLLHTRMSDHLASVGAQVLFEDAPVLFVRQGLQLAAAVADHAGYGGGWMLGVALTGIAGMPAYLNGSFGGRDLRVDADHDSFRSTVLVSGPELNASPGAITNRLMGRYVRSLGLEGRESLQTLLTDDRAEV